MTKYISSTPNIMGGQPVIAGTRVPISRILFLLKEGYPIEAIHDDYPHISIKELEGAVDEVARLIQNSPDVTKNPKA